MTRILRRGLFITLCIVIFVASTACWFKNVDVQFTFDNRTGSLLCFYPSPADASPGRCSSEIDTMAETIRTVGCGDGPGVEKNPITVVLTVKQGGRQIYNRTAECRVWQDSDRTFVIEQRGGEFFVADSLP
jgi:hypothetical protein